MTKKNQENKDIEEEKVDVHPEENGVDNQASEENVAEEMPVEDQSADEEDPGQAEIERLKTELSEAKDKYLRLYSEFENFRRRSAKERLELVSSANQDLVQDLLPVLDDFERAQESFSEKTDIASLKEGMDLIAHKFNKVLEQKGVKEMEGKEGIEFDPEVHEAITKIPAPKEELKGKVVDVIEKGYYLNDKVIRFAKVVIGS
jgi:molecular chaperone GrpE